MNKMYIASMFVVAWSSPAFADDAAKGVGEGSAPALPAPTPEPLPEPAAAPPAAQTPVKVAAPPASTTADSGKNPSEPSTSVDRVSAPPEGKASRYRVGVAIRAMGIGDDGIDMVMSTPSMPSAGLEGTVALYRRHRLSFAAGFGWDAGGREGDVRGLKTKTFLHHLLVPLEGRYALLPWFDLRGRVSPGASYLTVDFTQGSNGTTANGWAFSTEFAAGISVRMLGNRAETRTVELWGLVDGGYLLSTNIGLDAARTPPETQLGVQAASNYGSVSPRGGFLRFGLAAAF